MTLSWVLLHVASEAPKLGKASIINMQNGCCTLIIPILYLKMRFSFIFTIRTQTDLQLYLSTVIDIYYINLNIYALYENRKQSYLYL